MSAPSGADDLAAGVDALQALIVAGDQLRHAIAEHYGTRVPETLAMSHLRGRGTLSPRELADRLGLTPSTVTSLLDRLEAAGFAQRTAHLTDRRKTVVTLTEAGEAVLDTSDHWVSAAIERLGPEAIPQVASSMRRLAAGLEEQAVDILGSAPSSAADSTGATKGPGPCWSGAFPRTSRRS